MNKKILIVFLALALIPCFTGCGKKKEAVSDNTVALEPLKEETSLAYDTGETAVAETNTVGAMTFYPNDDEYMGALAGTNTFTLYFQNRGIVAGIGRVGIYDTSTGAIFSTVDVSDPEHCEFLPIDMQGTELTGWDDGTMVELHFDEPFTAGARYFVLIDPGCFILGDVQSKAVTNASLIRFSVKPYGINGFIDKNYSVGDNLSFNVFTGGDCKQVRISEYDPASLYVNNEYFQGEGTVNISFNGGGTQSFKIGFLDDTQEIDSITVTVNVDGGLSTLDGGEITQEDLDAINNETPAT